MEIAEDIYTARQVYSPRECQEFIDLSEEIGYQDAPISMFGADIPISPPKVWKLLREDGCPSSKMVVIQEVCASWSKDSRGAPGAVARNAVPERLAFIPSGGHRAVLEHLARYGEDSGFVASETVTSYDAPASLRYGCVRLVVADDRAQVMWHYDPGYIGAPWREGPPKEAFVVSVGQWGCVRYNGRLTCDEGWWYRKVVLNVGVFATPTGSEFLVREPDFTYDQTAHIR